MSNQPAAARAGEPVPTYDQLRRKGLEAIEELSSHAWTEYNASDAGVTILEHFCYALTDLGYRLGHAVEDLLAPPPGQAAPPNTTQLTAPRILPMGALTIRDYRKILVCLEGVKNAWLETVEGGECPIYLDWDDEQLTLQPHHSRPLVHLKGFYKVTFEQERETDPTRPIIKRIRESLHAHRNLCEDFIEIKKRSVEKVRICTELELDPEADPDQVQARAVYDLERFIAPPIPVLFLDQLLKEGTPPEEIFSGPLLKRGFIRDRDLDQAEPRTELRVSDLIQVLMDVPGVVAVRRILITAGDITAGNDQARSATWVLPLDPKRSARLDLVQSRFPMFKNGFPVAVDPDAVQLHLTALKDTGEPPHHSFTAFNPPEGRYRKPGRYFSVQNAFPANYGVGQAGLGAAVSARRHAQALQLKGYLLHFEQLLSGFLTRLEAFSQTMSLSPMAWSPVKQILEDVAQLDQLLNHNQFTDPALASDLPERILKRADQLLDHLTSRYGEWFPQFLPSGGPLWKGLERGLLDKINFLSHFPLISKHRASAFNVLSDHVSQWNASGLEKTLQLLFRKIRTRFRIRPRHPEGYGFSVEDTEGRVLLESSETFETMEDAEREAGPLSQYGDQTTHYQTNAVSGGYQVIWSNGSPKSTAATQGIYSTQQEANQSIHDLILFFQHNAGEFPFYLMENLLLRPRYKSSDPQKLLAVCVKNRPRENVEQCFCADPYSFRISVILPGWLARFRNAENRGFVEAVIRRRTPSHIFVRICWVGETDMAQFGASHQNWRAVVKQGRENKDPQELAQELEARNQLIETLAGIRTIFNPAVLREFAQDDQTPTILGRAVLGTLEEDTPQ